MKKPANYREFLVFTDMVMRKASVTNVKKLWSRGMRPYYMLYSGLPHPAELKRNFYDHYDRVVGNMIGHSYNLENIGTEIPDLLKEKNRQEENNWIDSITG